MIRVSAATYVHADCINSLSCADDIVLLAPSAYALHDLSDVYQVYAAKHEIVYNTAKTKYMVVPPVRSKVNYLESAQLSGRAVTFVDRFTYLRHVLHSDMTDDDFMRKQTTKPTVTGITQLRKFSFCSLGVKLDIFRSLCYSLY